MVYFCINVIGDKNFSVCKFFRKLYFTCILAEIAVYDQFFIAKCTDISVDILVIIKDQIIGTIDILSKHNDKFDYKVSWGCDLQTEHERYLTEQIYKRPVFVTDYPKEIKMSFSHCFLWAF